MKKWHLDHMYQYRSLYYYTTPTLTGIQEIEAYMTIFLRVKLEELDHSAFKQTAS